MKFTKEEIAEIKDMHFMDQISEMIKNKINHEYSITYPKQVYQDIIDIIDLVLTKEEESLNRRDEMEENSYDDLTGRWEGIHRMRELLANIFLNEPHPNIVNLIP